MKRWNRTRIISGILLSVVFAGCGAGDQSATNCWQLPIETHLPRLTTDGNRLFLSYIHSKPDGNHQLLYRENRRGEWLSRTDTAAVGSDWFVNWADFPSVVPLGEGTTFHHFLAYSGEGTYDYDIIYRVGARQIGKLHRDTVSAEHGFLSSAPLPGGGLQVSWLDGRATKAGATGPHDHGDDHDHGSGGAMTLRSATIAEDGKVRGATELDSRVCDCCATATVATNELTMVAYRDRSETEVRDISFVTKRAEEWSQPQPVNVDNWEISGCPVNGPALAANAYGDIAVAWYTEGGGQARVQFARYNVESDAFGTATVIDGSGPLGRLDLQMGEDGTAYLLGLSATETADSAEMNLWTIDNANLATKRSLARVSSARSSGFPQLALYRQEVYYARTVPGIGDAGQRVEICSLSPHLVE